MIRGVLLLLMLAGCANLPRDPDGTLERVQQEQRFAVGLVADGVGGRVVERVARETGAWPRVTRGQLEPLLIRLEEGELDLVVGGRFDAKSPWVKRVTLGPRLANGEHVVARNGENAWIALVQRATRAEGAQ